MTKIRYLTLLTALLCGTAGAQDFNPDSPAEPGEPPQPLVLLVTPAGSGSVAGARQRGARFNECGHGLPL